MAKKGSDLTVKKIRLGEDFCVETRIRVGGLQYLEDTYNKPIHKIDFKTQRIRDVVNLFVALGIGAYPDLPVDEIRKKIERLDLTDLTKFLDENPDIFGEEPKNSSKPHKQVKGNLTEKTS